MVEYDLPVCRVWQLGSRSRLALMVGNWDDAMADARAVLDSPGAPLARTCPMLIDALVPMRRDGSGAEGLDEAWGLAQRYQEPMRLPEALRRAVIVGPRGTSAAVFAA